MTLVRWSAVEPDSTAAESARAEAAIAGELSGASLAGAAALTVSDDGRRMAAAGVFLLAVFMVTKVAGYGQRVLVAHLFGTGRDMDAYVLAFTIPDIFLFLVIGGAVSSAFVPVTTERLARGRDTEALAVVNGVMSAALMILAGGVILLELSAPFFVGALAHQLPLRQQELALVLTRIILVQPLFLGLGGFALGVMNAYRRFRPLSLAPLAYDLAGIAGALLLTRVPFHGHPLGIRGLAIGVALGGFAHLAVQLPALLGIGWRPLRFRDIANPGVRRVAVLTIPIALGLVATQANIAVDRVLATGLPQGRLSALDFANEIAQIPNLTFTTALTLVTFPFFAEYAALGRMAELRRSATLAIRLNFFVLLPSAVVFIVLGPQVIALLLQRGAFTARSTDLVYTPLALFSVGIAAQASIFLVARVYYSLQSVVTPMLVAFASVVFNLVATLILIRPLGAGGLALATALASIFNFTLLVLFLRPRLGGFEGRAMTLTLLRVGAGCAAIALVAPLSWRLIAGGGATHLDARHYAAVVVSLVLSAAVYLGIQFALRSEEARLSLLILLRRRDAAKELS
jgi:putative peptidoglycan lipid II flippase